jgi:hypothetical protein
MTPNEIQEVASTAQMVGLPSWSNLVALLVGALGAFLGAYLSQKARDRATNENFAEVLKRLRKSTHDTEQIKSAISSKGWIDQQAWSQKRQIYSDVLLHLTKLSGLLSRCSAQFDPPKALRMIRPFRRSPTTLNGRKRLLPPSQNLRSSWGLRQSSCHETPFRRSSLFYPCTSVQNGGACVRLITPKSCVRRLIRLAKP